MTALFSIRATVDLLWPSLYRWTMSPLLSLNVTFLTWFPWLSWELFFVCHFCNTWKFCSGRSQFLDLGTSLLWVTSFFAAGHAVPRQMAGSVPVLCIPESSSTRLARGYQTRVSPDIENAPWEVQWLPWEPLFKVTCPGSVIYWASKAHPSGLSLYQATSRISLEKELSWIRWLCWSTLMIVVKGFASLFFPKQVAGGFHRHVTLGIMGTETDVFSITLQTILPAVFSGHCMEGQPCLYRHFLTGNRPKNIGWPYFSKLVLMIWDRSPLSSAWAMK